MKTIHSVIRCALFAIIVIVAWQATGACIAGDYRIYYGHVHNHSKMSDGKGSPEKAYEYAQQTAGLDFFGLSDHAERLSDAEWERIKSAAEARNQDGVFVTFWGFEWSHSFQGHVTVILTKDYTSARKSSTNRFVELVEWISARDALAFFNHPGRQDKTGAEFNHFNTTPSPNFVGIDLFNKIEGFSTYYYNDGYRRDDGNKGYYDEALSRGWRVGAAGSDDNHKANWGTRTDYRIAVLASTLTRPAITNALISRRFYATLDKNLSLSLTICDQPMGAVIEPDRCECRIRVSDSDTETVSQIVLIRNGTAIKTWQPREKAPEITTSLNTSDGEYYYIKVRQADGDEAISSPIWISSPLASQDVPSKPYRTQ